MCCSNTIKFEWYVPIIHMMYSDLNDEVIVFNFAEYHLIQCFGFLELNIAFKFLKALG